MKPKVLAADKKLLVFLMIAAAWIAAVFFTLFYVHGEDPAYIWDSRSYWEHYFTFGAQFHEYRLHALITLAHDIWGNDNNALPSAFLVPFYWSFGVCRAAYICGIVLLYLLPACLLYARAMGRAVGAERHNNYPFIFLAFFGVALLCPQFWAPSFIGLPDMIGCLPLFLFVGTWVKTDINRRMKIETIIYWGVLLWLPFLFRRWYAYTVISLFTTTSLFGAFQYYRDRLPARAAWTFKNALPWIAIRNIAAVFAVFLVCVLVLQGGFVDHILHTPYADIYSAYQLLDWREHFTRLYSHFGLFQILLALAGFALGVREAQTRAISLFAVTNIALTFKLFIMTQAFGMQHYIPLAAWMLILEGIGLWAIMQKAGTQARRVAVVGIYLLITLAGFYDVLVGPVPLFHGPLELDAYYQRKLANFPEYARMERDLERLLDDGKKVSVFSSNGYFCDSILQSVSEERLSPHIYFAAQVDKRDHFDLGTLFSDYVVVANPVQFHLRPSDQHVVAIPAKEFIDHRGIAHAYEALPNRYKLANDAVATIYRKTRPLRMDEIRAFFHELYAAYPEWRQEYGPVERMYMAGTYNVDHAMEGFRLSKPHDLGIYPDSHNELAAALDNPGVEAAEKPIVRVLFRMLAYKPGHCSAEGGGMDVRLTADKGVSVEKHLNAEGDSGSLALPSGWKHINLSVKGNGGGQCYLLVDFGQDASAP